MMYLDEPLTSPIEGFTTILGKYRPDKCRMKPHWCSQAWSLKLKAAGIAPGGAPPVEPIVSIGCNENKPAFATSNIIKFAKFSVKKCCTSFLCKRVMEAYLFGSHYFMLGQRKGCINTFTALSLIASFHTCAFLRPKC